jgi:hypothetical protein
MAASSRRKGVKGEAEVRRLLEAAGLRLRGLEGRGDWLAFTPRESLLHIEVKRQERVQLPIWLRQAKLDAPAEAIPVVCFRQNLGEWYAALPLADLVEVVR